MTAPNQYPPSHPTAAHGQTRQSRLQVSFNQRLQTCFRRRPVDSAPCLSLAFGTVTSLSTADCSDHMSVGRTLPQFAILHG